MDRRHSSVIIAAPFCRRESTQYACPRAVEAMRAFIARHFITRAQWKRRNVTRRVHWLSQHADYINQAPRRSVSHGGSTPVANTPAGKPQYRGIVVTVTCAVLLGRGDLPVVVSDSEAEYA